MEDITTRTVDARGMSPSRAYAALRAKAAGRTSYLFEATEPDERGEHRSVIGFLAKHEAAYPPGIDALGEVVANIAGLPAALPDASPSAASPHDVLSTLLFDAVLHAHGLAHWPDLAFVGREIRQITAITFDHVAGTLTIAAQNPHVLDRVASVIAAAPELPELPPATGTAPEHLFELPPEVTFTKQLTRAARRLTLGGVTELRLGRRFTAPARGADLFDVLRALRELAPGRHPFLIEHGASPVFPAYALTGVAGAPVFIDGTSGPEALRAALESLFPVERLCGSPAKEALAAWRDVAASAIAVRGTAVLRMRPGGLVEALRPHALVVCEDEQLHTHGVAVVVPDRDAAAHTAAAADDVRAELTAIRRAHDAAEAREARAAHEAEGALPN